MSLSDRSEIERSCNETKVAKMPSTETCDQVIMLLHANTSCKKATNLCCGNIVHPEEGERADKVRPLGYGDDILGDEAALLVDVDPW